MKRVWKQLSCVVLVAAFLTPAPAAANSLRLKENSLSRENLRLPNEPTPADDVTLTPEDTPIPTPENGAGLTPVDAPSPTPEDGAEPNPADALSSESSANEALVSLGELRDDLDGENLSLPDGLKDVGLLEGSWGFDHFFVDSGGNKLHADFQFDDLGFGVVTLTDKDNVYTTHALAHIDEDGSLKIRTGNFISETSSHTYDSMFIDYAEKNGETVFSGKSGFSNWEGQRMVRTAHGKKDASLMDSEHFREDTAPLSQPIATTGFGPELPADILNPAVKAQARTGADALSALNGSWRYSRDLLRKEDGQSLGLEFYFDKNGQGYSLLKDGSSQEFRAAASAGVLPDGTIRVKTEAYTNGTGLEYHPTFMECRSDASSDLICDVSNGWSHSEGSKLLSRDSLEKEDAGRKIEQLLYVPPIPELAPAPDQTTGPGVDVAALLAGTAEELNKKLNRKTEEDRKQKMEQRLSLDKGRDGSMSFLEGHWRCNTGLARTSDNQPVIVEFNFDKKGEGTAVIWEQSGKQFKASANATYKNGTLRINTSDYYGQKPSDGKYNKSTIQCINNDGYAVCSGRNGSAQWNNASFIRINQ